MTTDATPLTSVYSGWDGYQASLVSAIGPRSPEELAWRPAPGLRSAGEIARHISEGRLGWFQRTFGDGMTAAAGPVAAWRPEDTVEENPAELVRGLEATWQMIAQALGGWTAADLAYTYPLTYQGATYALSRQWVLWRIMAHDLHHGGELALALGLQGIALPELGDEGGHTIRPPLAEQS